MAKATEEKAPAGLNEALFAVQQELDGITKDSTNPHYKSSYADRTTILQTIRPLYAKYGLLLIQSPTIPSVKFSEDPVLALETTIIHIESGEKLSSTAIVPLPKADPQGYGSAITYTSRYALTMIHALPLLDDDGNGGSGRSEGNEPARTRATKSRATSAETQQAGSKSASAATSAPKTPAWNKSANAETTTVSASQPTEQAEAGGTAGGADTTTTETPEKPVTTAASASKPSPATGGKRKLWGS